MTTRIIDPLFNPHVTTAAKTETAGRLSNDKPGICPICQRAMRKVTAGGVDAFSCMEHALVMPAPDLT